MLKFVKAASGLVGNWPGHDQGFYSHLFLSGLVDINLDYNSSIVFSFGMNPEPTAGVISTGDVLQEESISAQESTWKNSYDGSTPAIIHFNADGKFVMPKVQMKLSNNAMFFKAQKCHHLMIAHEGLSFTKI